MPALRDLIFWLKCACSLFLRCRCLGSLVESTNYLRCSLSTTVAAGRMCVVCHWCCSLLRLRCSLFAISVSLLLSLPPPLSPSPSLVDTAWNPPGYRWDTAGIPLRVSPGYRWDNGCIPLGIRFGRRLDAARNTLGVPLVLPNRRPCNARKRRFPIRWRGCASSAPLGRGTGRPARTRLVKKSG